MDTLPFRFRTTRPGPLLETGAPTVSPPMGTMLQVAGAYMLWAIVLIGIGVVFESTAKQGGYDAALAALIGLGLGGPAIYLARAFNRWRHIEVQVTTSGLVIADELWSWALIDRVEDREVVRLSDTGEPVPWASNVHGLILHTRDRQVVMMPIDADSVGRLGERLRQVHAAYDGELPTDVPDLLRQIRHSGRQTD